MIRYLQAAHHPFLMPGDLPRPPARRSARTERDQRLLDLAEQRLRDLHLARCPEAAGRVAICVKCRYYPWSMASAWQATPDLRLLGTFSLHPSNGFGDVRQRFAIETTYRLTSGPDSDLDKTRIRRCGCSTWGIALILRNVWVDCTRWCWPGLVAAVRRDPLGFAAVPEDVAVVDACGQRNPGDAVADSVTGSVELQLPSGVMTPDGKTR